MIETTASTRFAKSGLSTIAGSDGSNAATKMSPLLVLNLLCLDAPLVAVSWMLLFARSFGIAVAPGGTAALFLTAWFIYLADRFGDNLSLDQTGSTSLRQRFCRRYRIAWLTGLLAVGGADAFVVLTKLNAPSRAFGITVAVCAAIYLCVNQLGSIVWRWLPLKEVAIGFLFATGVTVPLRYGLTSDLLPSWLCFGALCSLNCICIAVWERQLDLAQGRRSLATTFPFVEALVLPVAMILCLTSAFLGAICLAVSAALLAAVHFFRNRIQPDVRTALADLVLLSPIVAVLFERFGK